MLIERKLAVLPDLSEEGEYLPSIDASGRPGGKVCQLVSFDLTHEPNSEY